MRILLIHQYFLEKDDPGGSRFNEMTKVWVEAGAEVTVLAGMLNYVKGQKPEKYRGKTFHRSLYQPGLEVIRCSVSQHYNTNFTGRLWAYFSFVFTALWAGLFKCKGKYQVILVSSPPLFVGITAMLLSLFKRVPFVFEVRDLWPESAIDTGVVTNKTIIRLSYWLERLIYRRAALINVLTPAFKTALVEKKGVEPEKVIFIPNAADFSISDQLLNSYDPKSLREELNLNGKFVITYVGAHGVANHLVQVLDVAEQLPDAEVQFLLIGGGMQKNWLMEQARERKIANVKFIDPVPKKEVFKYILASDMGASVLKKVDTFKTIYSNKTFDYMSCKKPVLLAIDGVSRELVEQADCGIYVEPENPKDWIEKINQYRRQSDRAATQGKNGYLYAKEHFDRGKLALKYLEYLKKFN
jgi:glycosyltransferase involved in cell wall biosynthesis